MPPVAWPGTLPQTVDADSYGMKLGNTLLRSDMDVGPAKVRRRFTKSIDSATTTMTMTMAQWAILEAFFDIDLDGGANTFYFNDPLTQVQKTFRFVEPPDVKPMGGLYVKVSMSWEKLP
jgi:hypothetical protein